MARMHLRPVTLVRCEGGVPGGVRLSQNQLARRSASRRPYRRIVNNRGHHAIPRCGLSLYFGNSRVLDEFQAITLSLLGAISSADAKAHKARGRVNGVVSERCAREPAIHLSRRSPHGERPSSASSLGRRSSS